MTAVIDIRDLHKHFGHVRALDGLDLTVEEGEIHGFLGPNGAGKSTTIRVLLGVLRATSGQVRMLGRDPWADAVALHREIAYVPGDVTLWPSLTGGETIDLLARMRGGIDEARRAELIERFDLDPKKKARTYSTGNRQKVSLISALSSRARLLLLDEPSIGLDPLMEQVFRECVMQARDRGVTVLLSSHILAETEALCKRVTIIRGVKRVESGSLESMRHLSRTSIKAELLGDDWRSPPDQGRRGHQHEGQHPVCRGRCRQPRRVDPGARRRRACVAWSAGHPRWKSCSCATTRWVGRNGHPATRRCRHDHHRRRATARASGTGSPRIGFHRHVRTSAPVSAPRPDRASALGVTAVAAARECLHQQRRNRVSDCSRTGGVRRLDHGEPGATRAVRECLQRQRRCGGDLEGGRIPRADRRGRHHHGYPPHPGGRGNGSRRAAGLDRRGSATQASPPH